MLECAGAAIENHVPRWLNRAKALRVGTLQVSLCTLPVGVEGASINTLSAVKLSCRQDVDHSPTQSVSKTRPWSNAMR
jgi:hypothetical protein